jgi:hypothetical protein
MLDPKGGSQHDSALLCRMTLRTTRTSLIAGQNDSPASRDSETVIEQIAILLTVLVYLSERRLIDL